MTTLMTDRWAFVDRKLVLDGFTRPFYRCADPYQTKVGIEYRDGFCLLSLQTLPYENPTNDDLYGFVIAIKPDLLKKPVYVTNIRISEGPKTITFEAEKNADEQPMVVTDVRFDKTDTMVKCKAKVSIVKMTTRIDSGEPIGLNVIAYRARSQPEMTSLFPIRTTYYHDTGMDEKRRAKPMTNLRIAADVHTESRFMPIYLQDKTDADVNIGGVGSVQPHVYGKAELVYEGFVNKKLIITDETIDHTLQNVDLQWWAPDGSRKPLAPKIENQSAKTICLTFSHPEPLEDGAYHLAAYVKGEDVTRFCIFSFDKKQMVDEGERVQNEYSRSKCKTRTEVAYAPPDAKVERLLAMIPDRVGFYWLGAPEHTHLWPTSIYERHAERTDRLVLKKDGSLWPNDDAFVQNRSLAVQNRLGETVSYPYYEDEEGRRYFFDAHVWYKNREEVIDACKPLAKSDPMGAARLIYALAKAYAHYVPVYDHAWRNYPLDLTKGPPYPYVGGVWSWWFYMDLSRLAEVADAYAIVADTQAFDILSDKLQEDVQKVIEDEMFIPSIDYILSYHRYNSNMDYCVWYGLAAMARALDQPGYMHEAYARLSDYMEKTSLFDGFFMETTLSYHNQSIHGVQKVMQKMQGWSDPPGYESPLSGQRLDELDFTGRFDLLEAAIQIPKKLSYPDGKPLPLQDTWAYGTEIADEATDDEPVNEAQTLLLPAAGVLKMERLQKDGTRAQLFMMFTPKYGHNHFDPLNVVLFFGGQELLPDIGYNYTKYRSWSMSTLAHNTVTVDGSDMEVNEESRHGGRVMNLSVARDDMKMTRVDWTNAYPQCRRYERELIWMADESIDESFTYVVDIFRVAGGRRHEYSVQADANHDATIECNLEKKVYGKHLFADDVEVTYPEKALDKGSAQELYYGYIYLNDVERACAENGHYQICFHTQLAPEREGAGLKVFGFTGQPHSEVFLGRSPCVRLTRTQGKQKDTNDDAKGYTMPKFVTRCEGEDLERTYVHVLEPIAATAAEIVTDVSVWQDEAQFGHTIVRISYGDTTDVIVSAADENGFSHQNCRMIGKTGRVRIKNGNIQKMDLVGGTLLQYEEHVLKGMGPLRGKIERVLRRAEGSDVDALVTNTFVPSDTSGYVIVRHPDGTTHALEIDRVVNERHETKILIKGCDPGFMISRNGTSQRVGYPFTRWTKAHTFRIDNSESKTFVNE